MHNSIKRLIAGSGAVLLLALFTQTLAPAQYASGGAQDFEGYIRPCPDALQLGIDVTHTSEVAAEDGSISLTVSGGTPPYRYCWSSLYYTSGNEDIENLAAGDYMIVVTDAQGCDATTIVQVDAGSVVSSASERRVAGEAATLAVTPNPSEGLVTISYRLPQAQTLTLEIHDKLGNVIASLHNGRQSAGSHTLPFDGSALASGNYFVRLRLNNSSITQQFALMR